VSFIILYYDQQIHNSSWFQTFAVFWMLYAFFWVILCSLNFICRRFGTLCLFHLHRRVGMNFVFQLFGTFCLFDRVFRNVGIQNSDAGELLRIKLTNTQLFHKLWHSYMFRHYRVVLKELVINTLPSCTSISNAAVGNYQLLPTPITLLQVSTLSCHPQGACNQYLAKLHKYFKCSCW